jgi:hypothetical protein
MVERINEKGHRLNWVAMHIPTRIIPINLRPIWSRFLLRWGTNKLFDGTESIEEIRADNSRYFQVVVPLE